MTMINIKPRLEVKSLVTTLLVSAALLAPDAYHSIVPVTVEKSCLIYGEIAIIFVMMLLMDMTSSACYCGIITFMAFGNLLSASAVQINNFPNGNVPSLRFLQVETSFGLAGHLKYLKSNRGAFILRSGIHGADCKGIASIEGSASSPRVVNSITNGSHKFRDTLYNDNRSGSILYATRGSGEDEEMINYYKVLSLPEDCSEEDIKAKHEEITESLKSLPSVDKRIKQTIKEAYKVLSNPTSRAMYDQKLKLAQEESTSTDYSDEITDEESDSEGEIELFNDSDGDDEFEITIEDSPKRSRGGLSGFLGNLFGFNRDTAVKENVDTRNGDISTTLEVDIKDLVFGGKVPVTLDKFVRCTDCNTNKQAQREYLSHCTKCKGRGMISKSQRTPFGYISATRSCASCNGRGISRIKDCSKCSNTGRVHETAAISIDIPSGTRAGSTFKVKGGGHSGGYFNKSGNLFVKVVSNQNNREYLEDNKVYTCVDVNYVDTILGGTIDIETFSGPKKVDIPPGSQHGNEVPVGNYNGVKHLIKLQVAFPKNPSKEEKALLQKIAALRK